MPDSPIASAISAVSSGVMLQDIMPALESLSVPSDVSLTQSITLPINWTRVTLKEDLVIQGINSTQVLNMSGVPSLFSLGTSNSTLSLRNLVLVDGCTQYHVNNSDLLSIQYLPFMITMAGISYPRQVKKTPETTRLSGLTDSSSMPSMSPSHAFTRF
jgi:hypothetical protein